MRGKKNDNKGGFLWQKISPLGENKTALELMVVQE